MTIIVDGPFPFMRGTKTPVYRPCRAFSFGESHPQGAALGKQTAMVQSPERALQTFTCGALSGLARVCAPMPRALPWAAI